MKVCCVMHSEAREKDLLNQAPVGWEPKGCHMKVLLCIGELKRLW